MKAEFQNVGPLGVASSKLLDRFLLRHLSGAKLIYDHGCGYGTWARHVSMLVGAKMAIYDPDPQASAHARELLGEKFSDSDGPFDGIICFAVLELLDKQEQVDLLRTFADKLRGRLVIQYNVYNALSLRWLAMRFVHGNPIAWHEKHRFHRSYLKRRQVEDLFHAAGFSIVERCHPVLENHLPRRLNSVLGPMVPAAFHMTFYYALEKN